MHKKTYDSFSTTTHDWTIFNRISDNVNSVGKRPHSSAQIFHPAEIFNISYEKKDSPVALRFLEEYFGIMISNESSSKNRTLLTNILTLNQLSAPMIVLTTIKNFDKNNCYLTSGIEFFTTLSNFFSNKVSVTLDQKTYFFKDLEKHFEHWDYEDAEYHNSFALNLRIVYLNVDTLDEFIYITKRYDNNEALFDILEAILEIF